MCSDSTSTTRPRSSRRSSNSPTSSSHRRPVTSRMSWSRLLASSSGAKTRKLSGLRLVTSRSHPPSTRVGSCTLAPGVSTRTVASRQSGRSSARNTAPPLATGFALMRRSPEGGRSRSTARGRPSSSNSSSGRYERIHASSVRRCSSLSRAIGERHLVSAKGALHLLAVHDGRTGPALRRAEHDHRPWGMIGPGRQPVEAAVESGRQLLVDEGGIVTGHDVWGVPVAAQQRQQLLLGDARQQRGVGDLVLVQRKHREHCSVALGDRGTWRNANSSPAGRSRLRRRPRRRTRRDPADRSPRRTCGAASIRAHHPRGRSRASRVHSDWALLRGTRSGASASPSRVRRASGRRRPRPWCPRATRTRSAPVRRARGQPRTPRRGHAPRSRGWRARTRG